MTKQEFAKQFNVVWSLREDLSDGMEIELKEVLDEYRFYDPNSDYSNLAQWVDSILIDWGYPAVFGLQNECVKQGHHWQTPSAIESSCGMNKPHT